MSVEESFWTRLERKGYGWIRWVLVVGCLVTAGEEAGAQADYKRFYDEDNLPRVKRVFQAGGYDLVIQVCDYSLQRGQPSWEWRTLRFQALTAVGRYEDAVAEALETTRRFPDELGALLEAYELFTELGRVEDAARMLNGINNAASAVPKRDRTAIDYVRLGRAALVLGADPAKVLDQYFGAAKEFEAKGEEVPEGLVEAYLAAGQLALEKDDYGRAADEFRAGLKFVPDHPELLFGLAESFAPDNRKRSNTYLQQVLEEAPIHFGALFLIAENSITYEQYGEAEEALVQVESVNARHPKLHAYRAILAELERNDRVEFEALRERALSIWENNPEIDFLIGAVLSRKYRHEEGAESQRRALKMDPDFLPAKLQLALDYLRLGEVEKAWPLVDEVGAVDEYNVLALTSRCCARNSRGLLAWKQITLSFACLRLMLKSTETGFLSS
ncbi:MAG: tetratricopeptide repeat protein [Verrucomicrobiota bacterium]